MRPKNTRKSLLAILFFLLDNRQGLSFSFSKSGHCLGRNTSKCTDYTFASRNHNRNLRLSSYTSEIERVTTEYTKGTPTYDEIDGTHNSLIPLSKSPLLLSSSNPLINPNDCKVLIRYLEQLEEDGENTSFTINSLRESGIWKDSHHSHINDSDIIQSGQKVLEQVRDTINSLTNTENDDDEIMLPRILAPQVLKTGTVESRENVLPNCLHVDNVNDMVYRHISAILYLTDEVSTFDSDSVALVGGATTFPLAIPIQNTDGEGTENFDEDQEAWNERVNQAAINLIGANVHHTAISGQREGVFLDQAGFELFQKETNDRKDYTHCNRGVRVEPSAGKLCVFHNLLDDGRPDPRVFHGAEAVIGRRKVAGDAVTENYTTITDKRVALVFFKEMKGIDTLSAGGKENLEKEASDTRQWLITNYC